MDYPMAELIDRAAIFVVKAENGLPVAPQRDFLLKELPITENGSYQELVKIHRIIWTNEEMITAWYKVDDFHAAGKIYKEIRELNIRRSHIKNDIARRFNGLEDLKNFPHLGRK